MEHPENETINTTLPSLRRDVRKRPFIRVPKAPEIVADTIRERIVRGELQDGDLLQSEIKLMEEFGVSRPTIREAFRILEAEHLVTVSRGARGGAVVHAPDPELIANYALMVLRTEKTTISEVYQARLAFEPPAARICAESPEREEIARILSEILDEENAAVEKIPEFSALVAHFHRAIVELSGNRPLMHMAAVVNNVVTRHQSRVLAQQRVGQATEHIRAIASVGLKSQKRLIQMIKAGDAEKAEAHWREHMIRAQKAWLPDYENDPISELFPPENRF